MYRIPTSNWIELINEKIDQCGAVASQEIISPNECEPNEIQCERKQKWWYFMLYWVSLCLGHLILGLVVQWAQCVDVSEIFFCVTNEKVRAIINLYQIKKAKSANHLKRKKNQNKCEWNYQPLGRCLCFHCIIRRTKYASNKMIFELATWAWVHSDYNLVAVFICSNQPEKLKNPPHRNELQ